MEPIIYLDDLILDTTIRLTDVLTVTISLLALGWSLISFLAVQKDKARQAAKLSIEFIEGYSAKGGNTPLWHVLEIANYGLSPIVIRKVLIGRMAISDPQAGPLFRLDAGGYRHLDLSRQVESYLQETGRKKWLWLFPARLEVTLIDGLGRRWKATRVRQDVAAAARRVQDPPMARAEVFHQ